MSNNQGGSMFKVGETVFAKFNGKIQEVEVKTCGGSVMTIGRGQSTAVVTEFEVFDTLEACRDGDRHAGQVEDAYVDAAQMLREKAKEFRALADKYERHAGIIEARTSEAARRERCNWGGRRGTE